MEELKEPSHGPVLDRAFLERRIIPADVVHLRQATAALPLCTHQDLSRAQDSARGYTRSGPLLPNGPTAPHEVSGAYAWLKLALFLDENKAVRDNFNIHYPGVEMVYVDLGSSLPLFMELREAMRLRKCGDLAKEAIGLALSSQTHADGASRAYKQIVNIHSRSTSPVRWALSSNLQIALATVPPELSGDVERIGQYVTSAALSMALRNRQILLNTQDRRTSQGRKGAQLTKDSPIEARWRVDAARYNNPDSKTAFELLMDTEIAYLDPAKEAEVVSEFDFANLAASEGNRDLADAQRLRASLMSREYKIKEEAQEEDVVRFISTVVESAVEHLLVNNQAAPTRFYSIDMEDPDILVAQAPSGSGNDILSTSLFRRAVDKLITRHPSHIVGEVGTALDNFEDGSIMLATSFEGHSFYSNIPTGPVDLRAAVNSLASTIEKIVRKLHVGGVYLDFPWDVVQTPEEEKHDDSSMPLELMLARKKFLPFVFARLERMEDARVELLHHSLGTLVGWMTEFERSMVMPRSPVFKRYANADPDTEIPYLRITKIF